MAVHGNSYATASDWHERSWVHQVRRQFGNLICLHSFAALGIRPIK
jgi:hypothetical protein